MAYRTDAYRADTGELFSTVEEAEKAEIQAAANILGGITTEGLLQIVNGEMASPALRAALRRLAAAIPPEPPKAEPSGARAA
jgi:hypothetical protein